MLLKAWKLQDTFPIVIRLASLALLLEKSSADLVVRPRRRFDFEYWIMKS